MIENVAANLYALWSGVLGHLWQVTLILLPLFLFDRWLRRAPASVTHVIWSAGLIKLFLPLALFGGLARGVLRLFPDATLPLISPSSNPALTAVTTVLTVPGSPATAGMENHWLIWIVAGFTAVWVSGAAWFLVRLAREAVGMKSAGSEPTIRLSSEEAAKFRQALDRVGVPFERVTIGESATLPSVVGLFKPTIRLPRRLIDRLSDDELCAVLVHEDAHRRRFDPLQVLVRRLCAALFFFYPLIWPLLRRLRETTEFACDDAAVRSGIPRDTYARAVSRTLQLGLSPAGVVSMAGAGNESLIKRRLDRLTITGRSNMTLTHRLLIAAVAFFVGIGSFWPLQKAVGDSRESHASLIVASAEDENPRQIADDKPKTNNTTERKVVEAYTTELASKPPQLLDGPPPKFPEAAKKAGVGAEVVVLLRVTADGTVDSVTVDVKSKSHAEDFEKAVRDVCYKWRFNPAKTEDAKLRKAWVKTKIQFKLDDCDGTTKEDDSSK